MNKVLFYFPYQEECGVPVLFLRMSRWLAENHGNEFDVYVVDYENGAMARNLRADDRVKLYISGKSDGIVVEDNDIVIMQSMNPAYFPRELHVSSKAKIFFWTLHFRNLTPSLLPLPGLRNLPFKYLWIYKLCSLFYERLLKRLSGFINDMIVHNAHYFMDVSTMEQTIRHIKLIFPDDMGYLPVPASDYNGPLKTIQKDKETINVCWIGRISYEKTPILIHTIKKCSQYALESKQKIHFYIRGFGEFEDWVNNLDVENDFFSKSSCLPIKFSEIDEFLLDNVDIMFAMGTSALESAKLGIPTVLVDYTATSDPIATDYKFSYLYKRTGYDLGHLITKTDLEKNNKSLDLIFNELNNNGQQIAEDCRKYFNENHSLSSVGKQFYETLKLTSFTYDMIDPTVIKQPIILKIYNKMRRLK